jgi:serine protease DegS|tara:strand:+ start:604 stop:1665 length:1062 start_codon:yes stop_codon:yes gene_type:complete
LKDSFTFLLKSAFVGAIISGVILLLVPDLRHGSSLNLSMFNPTRQTSDKLSFNHAVNVSGPAVVNIYSQSIESGSIYNRSQSVERTSLGSGVIMSEDGLILTCLHVIANANSILVGLQDGRRAEAQIIGYDPYTDLAVLKVAEDNLHVIPQLDDPATRVGDLVLAIGNPYNLGQTITQGVVSRVGRNGLAAYFDFIQMDAVLNEGNSGGALIDSNGYLIGINNANFKTLDSQRRVKEVDGVSFAIPYGLAKKVMDEIVANGRVTRGQLGVGAAEVYGRSGILITSVSPGSSADKGGIRTDDVMLAINGQPTDSVTQTLDFIAETKPGTELQVEVSRGGQLVTLTVVVAELGAQ